MASAMAVAGCAATAVVAAAAAARAARAEQVAFAVAAEAKVVVAWWRQRWGPRNRSISISATDSLHDSCPSGKKSA